jgi:hypothetical protein
MINFGKTLSSFPDFMMKVLVFFAIAFLSLIFIVLFAAGLSELFGTKEKICVNGSVYHKETNDYWVKTSKECVPSIPVSKD